ncbi:MAG: sigma-70 family RNA polymerase sigma factor [Myxococcales bacterium]
MRSGREGDPCCNAAASAAENEAADADELARRRDEVNALVVQHLDLVESIARHVSRTIDNAVDFEELTAAGREGLVEAARRFDSARGTPFRAFAGFRIEGAIIDGVRKSFRLPRRLYARLAVFEATRNLNECAAPSTLRPSGSYPQAPVPEQQLSDQLAAMATAAIVFRDQGIAPDSAEDESEQANPENAYAQAELLGIVRDAIDGLDEHEATVIRLHYFEGKSFESAAETMRISKPWASRLHARGIELLTKRLRAVERG